MVGKSPFEGEEFFLNNYSYSPADGEKENYIIKKSHFVPEKGSPNPLRRQYDYTGEKAGPNWIDRVEEHEKKRKKRKATLKEILHVESQVRKRNI